jgi:regulatory protein
MIKVQELRKKGKNYLVTISKDSNEIEYLVSEDIIIEYRLLSGKELLEDQYKKLLNAINKDAIYQKVLKYALFKPRTRKEIFVYLDKLKVEEMGYFLTKLEKLRLLNDDLYAENYVSESINFKKIGPRKIHEDLKTKGLPETLILKYLEHYPKALILKNIEYWFDKKLRTIKNKPYFVVKKNLLTAIMNKGFEYEEIIHFLDTKDKILHDEANEEEALKKEILKLKEQYHKEDLKTSLNQYLIQKLMAKGYQYSNIKKYL